MEFTFYHPKEPIEVSALFPQRWGFDEYQAAGSLLKGIEEEPLRTMTVIA